MSVSQPNQPNFPQESINAYKNSLSFWNELGIPASDIKEVRYFSNNLYAAPVGTKVENSFKVSDYSNLGQQPEGEIGLQAAQRLLGHKVEEGDEMVARMIDHGAWPEDVYDVSLEVVNETEVAEDVRPRYENGAIMLKPDETPPSFEHSELCDFVVFNDQASTLVADQDYEFNLEEWR